MPEEASSAALSRPLLLVVDGNSLLHRAFHALPLMDADGVYTNAVHGFMMMFLKVVRDYAPFAAAVAFDTHAPTFRHVTYDGYKAGRKATPDEMKMQFPVLREVLQSMHVGVLSADGWEADDILGTCARLCSEGGRYSCMLLTGDRDALQLVTEDSMVLFTRKGISEAVRFTPEAVMENYGITPAQVTDWKGLAGDSSDNIPGVPGVGDKTAVKLLSEYGTLENVLAHGEEIKGKLGEKIRANASQARFSKDLATIRPEAPIDFDPEKWTLDRLGDGAAVLGKYRLGQVLRQLRAMGAPVAAPAPDGAAAKNDTAKGPGDDPDAENRPAPAEGSSVPLPRPETTPLASPEEIRAFAAAHGAGDCAVCLTDTDLTVFAGGVLARAELGGDLLNPGMTPQDALRAMSRLLSGPRLHVHGGKRLMHVLRAAGLPPPRPVWDTMLAQYLLSPLSSGYALEELADPDAYGVYALSLRQKRELEEKGMSRLMTDVEMPLQEALFDMENEGFRVDERVLRELGDAWNAQADALKEEIYALAGVRDFNINSPKQLGQVLFETLKLPGGKKNSKGYSTDASVLEKLRESHPIADKILEYRQIMKLTGTYVGPLIDRMDPEGRVHSVFDQTATATGRISSSEPNLQNIPVRTEMGREIRRAFIPRDGWKLCDADYSQIELRVLAHLSGDEAMRDAFLKGQDVHTRTASEVCGVPMDEVTPAMRRSAKAVNFGLVYGISEFGLSRNIGIGRAEAHDFIARYFERYPGIRRYMDESVRRGRTEGYTTTLLGRRRPLPEIHSPNGNIRAFGDRVAMNAPVQGTAADIIKIAMVRVHRRLKEEGCRARLILQVHDELLIECPPEEESKVCRMLKECMENAVTLSVPLTVEVKCGDSWYETK